MRPSVLEVLLEIAKFCDVYLMERILDDESGVSNKDHAFFLLHLCFTLYKYAQDLICQYILISACARGINSNQFTVDIGIIR